MYMYFINRKLQCVKNVTSTQIDLKINAISIKRDVFVNI